MDHNPWLRPSARDGRGSVEKPENLEWQTRAAPPSEFETALGDALERVFARGAETLEDVVRELNGEGLRDAHGEAWTPASFQALMRELGR